MARTRSLVCLLFAVGCGAAPTARVAEPTPSIARSEAPIETSAPAEDPVTVATSAPADDPVASTDAVGARLDARPAFAVPWSTHLDAMSREDVSALCAYERESIHPSPIEVDCGDGRHALVGGTGGACREDSFGDAQVLGQLCPVTVGDLVACELALRERPCAYAGVGLPECAAFDACREWIRAHAAAYVVACQRVPFDR